MRKRWKLFCDEYMRTWNATKAYQLAYPAAKTTSAGANGHKLLKNTEISAYINDHLMPPDEIIGRLNDQARGVGEYLDPVTGELDIPSLISDGKGHLIKKQKKNKDGFELELYDAQAALALLGKHHKLFTDIQEHRGELKVVDDDRLDRSVSTLADALREIVSGQATGAASDLDAAEQTPVAGVPDEGG